MEKDVLDWEKVQGGIKQLLIYRPRWDIKQKILFSKEVQLFSLLMQNSYQSTNCLHCQYFWLGHFAIDQNPESVFCYEGLHGNIKGLANEDGCFMGNYGNFYLHTGANYTSKVPPLGCYRFMKATFIFDLVHLRHRKSMSSHRHNCLNILKMSSSFWLS